MKNHTSTTNSCELSYKPHFELHFEPDYFVHYQAINGDWYKKEWSALTQEKRVKRIQYNTKRFKNYIIIDIDNANLYKYKNKLPEPNFIIKNRDKRGGHLFYVLSQTVKNEFFTKIWQNIQKEFSIKAGGDILNRGFIGKNINNNIDFEIEFLETSAYDINYLNTFTTSTEQKQLLKATKQEQQTKGTKEVLVGRNVSIFDDLRVFSYAQIKKSVNDEDFLTIVTAYAQNLNNEYKEQLSQSELNDIIKSVTKYCINNKQAIKESKKRGKMQLQNENIDLKDKQRLSAKYSSEVKQAKTEAKIKTALIEMKYKTIKISMYSVAKYTNLSKSTISKYKELLG